MAAQKEKEIEAWISLQNQPRWEHLSMALLQPQVIWLTFQTIKYKEMVVEGNNEIYCFIQSSLHLPFSPIMEGASFLLKAWQFWSLGGFVSH